MSETPRPDPYEDELAEGFGQDAVSKEDISAVAARLVLRGLLRREADWRRRVGDEDYERSVAYWQAAVEGRPRPADPFAGDEEYEAFLLDLRRSLGGEL